MRFASLGSGSSGNGLIVESGPTRLLLDCGFNLRDTVARLARLGLQPEELSGILVTHEHSDHIGGVARLARKYRLPVWMTYGTYRNAESRLENLPDLHFIDSDETFTHENLEITAYTVPHDAREPVQYVFSDGAARLGVLTDTGRPTPHIEAHLTGCHALVLECNHDRDMLWNGPYPPGLKKRVDGPFGHLANQTAADLLRQLDTHRLQHIIAAHLSEQNNQPALAQTALSEALGCAADWIGVAEQATGFAWRQISL
jgi:phosphoribosyl 1,2-cyclic phosphodiesterase